MGEGESTLPPDRPGGPAERAFAGGTGGGWRLPERARRLEWPEDHWMHGLWVDVRFISIGEYRAMSEQWAGARIAAERGEVAPEGEGLDDVLRAHLRRVVIAWNYVDGDDESVPVPVTDEDFDAIPPEVTTEVRSRWFRTVGQPPAPLSSPSSGSGRSADMEAQLSMEIL